MNRLRAAGYALALAGLMMSEAADAIPLPDVTGIGTRTGYLADDPTLANERMTYNPLSQHLSYTSGMATYHLAFCTGCGGPSVPADDYTGPASFTGLLAFSAGVAQDGSVTDSGSMLWLGDLGSGQQILASGELRAIGSSTCNFFSEANTTSCSGLGLVFGLSYVDPVMSVMGDGLLMLYNRGFRYTGQFDSPLILGFDCMGPASAGPCQSSFDDTGLLGLQVPEPGTLALIGMGLLGLGLVKVGRRSCARRGCSWPPDRTAA